MKKEEKKLNLLLTVIMSIFFICLFILPSLASTSLPGDFVGPMGDPTPDGKVDFNDLMVFATAYGSETGDPNWNDICDICGYLGDPNPDGKVNFDDLMIFATNYGKELEVIIPETTEIIDQETEEVVTLVSEDQSTIVFSTSTTQTDRIDPGDIIVMGVTDQTPYGLLRRVTSIDRGLTKESQVILDTEFTTLEEAIQKGHWEYSHTLKPEDIEKGFVFPEGIQPVRGKASTTLDFEYQIDIILYDQDDNPATTEDNIMATGYLAFDYQIIFDGDIDWFTLKYFIFKNIIQTDSKLDVSVGASVSVADLADIGDVTIGKPIPFTPVTVYIPTPIPVIFIPLVFFPSIELKVGIEGEAHILLKVGIRQTASYTAGIEFTEGNWQNITTPPQVDYYEGPIEVDGGIHIIAHAGSQLNCKLYNVAGPYCNIFDYLDFEADTTLDPWWDLDAMLKVLAGVKLDIFTIHWDSGELELINLTRDVADAGGTFGGTGPVHNLAKDTYYTTIQAALDDADNNNTIEVFDGTYDESITFPSANRVILQSVNGASSTIIRGNHGSPTATFDGSLEDTTLEGFTITHADEQSGRGINISNSNLSIENCNISGNSFHHLGGGIYNGFGGILTITESTISDNSSVRQYGSMSGGGIYNSGTLTITGSTISGNYASGGGGYTYYGASGGGISNDGTLIINESTISGNYASGEGDASGGGISNGGGTLTIAASTVSDNSVWAYYNAWGGGIYNGGGTLTITGSIISGNYARANYYNAWGGGIYNSGGTLTITGSIISDNSVWAYYYDAWGGIYLSSSGTIAIGGDIASDKNTICGNYKTGEDPALDQQIRDKDDGDLYETYKDTNYISAYCE